VENLRFPQHLKLVFPHLDVHARPLLHTDAVKAGALRAKRPAILGNHGSVEAGVEDLDDGAVLQGLHQRLRLLDRTTENTNKLTTENTERLVAENTERLTTEDTEDTEERE
jgi:hypothetical protein